MRYVCINKDFYHAYMLILSFVAGCYVTYNVMN